MQAKKLTELAIFLREKVAPLDALRKKNRQHGIFDMRNWMLADDEGLYHDHAALECGAPACAAGWATAIWPELRFNAQIAEIQYGAFSTSVQAVRAFFDITDDQLNWLFGGYHHRRTAEQEADIIDEFVKSGGRVPYHAY